MSCPRNVRTGIPASMPKRSHAEAAHSSFGFGAKLPPPEKPGSHSRRCRKAAVCLPALLFILAEKRWLFNFYLCVRQIFLPRRADFPVPPDRFFCTPPSFSLPQAPDSGRNSLPAALTFPCKSVTLLTMGFPGKEAGKYGFRPVFENPSIHNNYLFYDE